MNTSSKKSCPGGNATLKNKFSVQSKREKIWAKGFTTESDAEEKPVKAPATQAKKKKASTGAKPVDLPDTPVKNKKTKRGCGDMEVHQNVLCVKEA